MNLAELSVNKFKNKKFLAILLAFILLLAEVLAIAEFSANGVISFWPVLMGALALLGLLILLPDFSEKVSSIQKLLLFLTVAAGFIGPAFLEVSLGPINLFPYRILLILVWLLFFTSLIFTRGRLDISHLKVRPYFYYLAAWLLYSILSLLWALDKGAALREITFLFLAFSVMFFVTYYLSDLDSLRLVYSLWLVMMIVLFPVGFWEIITGHHLSISALAHTSHPVKRFMPSAFFHNPNDFATSLALGLTFTLGFIRYHRTVVGRFTGASIFVVGLFLLTRTFSRANLLALLAGIAFWLLFLINIKDKLKVVVIVGLIAALVWVAFPDIAQSIFGTIQTQLISLVEGVSKPSSQRSMWTRFNLMRNALFFFTNSMGFGVGAGNSVYYMENFSIYSTYGISDLHNWWLHILTNYGLLVFLGYLIFYFSLLGNLLRAHRKLSEATEKMFCEVAIVGLVVFSIANMSSSSIMALKPHWLFFAFALAFLNYLRLKEARSTS